MSQLNNLNESEANKTPKEKMKLTTKIIIFLSIFFVICVAFTVTAILIKNIKPTFSSPSTSFINEDGLGIKSLTEQYNENDLKITTVSDSKGTRDIANGLEYITSKLTIEYIKIEGLKNKEIENKINKEIMVFVYSLYTDEELADPEIDYMQIYANSESNFGNTLSVYINKTIFYPNNTSKEINSTNYYLNYDLTTGNKLKFTDLFTNSSLKNVLIQCVYDNVLSNYTYLIDDDEWPIDMSKADLSTVEEETYAKLNKLMNNLDNIKFYYTPSYICISDYDLTITMSRIYQNIAIYNRFKTDESIFDGTYVGNKNMFVFSRRYSYVENQYSKYEDIYDNFRVEALVEMNKDLLHDSSAKEKLNSIIKTIENEISKLKKEAKQNTKKAYVYTAYFSISSGESYDLNIEGIPNNMLFTYGNSKVYKMTKEYYNKVFIAEIASYYNTLDGGGYFPVFDYYKEDKNVTVQNLTEIDESIDLYTNKTINQLIGESHIEGEKKYLEAISQNLNINSRPFDDLEEELTYIYNSIMSIQKEYNLSDENLKDVLDLYEKVKKSVKEKNQSQEILDNTITNSVIDTQE